MSQDGEKERHAQLGNDGAMDSDEESEEDGQGIGGVDEAMEDAMVGMEAERQLVDEAGAGDVEAAEKDEEFEIDAVEEEEEDTDDEVEE